MRKQNALEVWTDEQLARVLLTHLYRYLDAGGISSGRSFQSEMLEPAMALLDRHRPQGDINEWPSPDESTAAARDRIRRQLTPSSDPPVVSRSGEMEQEHMLIGAEAMARVAHQGQTELSTGDDYILHVGRVVALVDGDDEKAVAWLHDVVEDSEVFSEDADDKLRQIVPEAIVQAVLLLTRGWYQPKSTPYAEYINHIVASRNGLAIAVKIADLRDHLRPNCPERLRPKYEAALAVLTGEGNQPPRGLRGDPWADRGHPVPLSLDLLRRLIVQWREEAREMLTYQDRGAGRVAPTLNRCADELAALLGSPHQQNAPCPLLTEEESPSNPFIASCGTMFDAETEWHHHERKHKKAKGGSPHE